MYQGKSFSSLLLIPLVWALLLACIPLAETPTASPTTIPSAEPSSSATAEPTTVDFAAHDPTIEGWTDQRIYCER